MDDFVLLYLEIFKKGNYIYCQTIEFISLMDMVCTLFGNFQNRK